MNDAKGFRTRICFEHDTQPEAFRNAFSGVAVLVVPTGIVTAGFGEQFKKCSGAVSEADLGQQCRRDDERDRLLRERADGVKRLAQRIGGARGDKRP